MKTKPISELVIKIEQTDQEEGGYMYTVYDQSLDSIVEGADLDGVDGGQCTTTLARAIEMAAAAAIDLARERNEKKGYTLHMLDDVNGMHTSMELEDADTAEEAMERHGINENQKSWSVEEGAPRA